METNGVMVAPHTHTHTHTHNPYKSKVINNAVNNHVPPKNSTPKRAEENINCFHEEN